MTFGVRDFVFLQESSSRLLVPIKTHNATTPMMAIRISGTRHTRRLIPPTLLHGRNITELATNATNRGTTHQIVLYVLHVLLPVHGVAKAADAGPPRLVGAAGGPGPAGAAGDGQVVPAEGEKGAGGAHEEAKEDVEAVVAKVVPARGGDEDGREKGGHGEGEEVQGRGGGLAAGRGEGGVVRGQEKVVGVVGVGPSLLVFRVTGGEGGVGGWRVGVVSWGAVWGG